MKKKDKALAKIVLEEFEKDSIEKELERKYGKIRSFSLEEHVNYLRSMMAKYKT